MFNFKPKTSTTDNTDASLALLDRLDELHKRIDELAFQNSELRRTMTRVETKLTRFGIAAGFSDAVSRQG